MTLQGCVSQGGTGLKGVEYTVQGLEEIVNVCNRLFCVYVPYTLLYGEPFDDCKWFLLFQEYRDCTISIVLKAASSYVHVTIAM